MRMLKVALLAGALAGLSLTGAIAAGSGGGGGGMSSMPSDTGPRYDPAEEYAKAIKAFYDAGCRYLQLDDTSLSYFCDPEQRKMLAERGDDPEQLVFIYRDVLNAALKAKPADMQITTHTCRGNFKSTFIASGKFSSPNLSAACRAVISYSRESVST